MAGIPYSYHFGMGGGVVVRGYFIITTPNNNIAFYNYTTKGATLIIADTVLRQLNGLLHKFFFPCHISVLLKSKM
jgi:hypothetical protein